MHVRTMLLAILALLAVDASAQEPQPGGQRPLLRIEGDYRGLRPEDMNAYCFWAGQIYSIGASFCVRETSSTVCTENPGKRPIWVTNDNDKLCAKNPSITPQ